MSTPATDIFNAGSILYFIVTGHWPYRGLGVFQSAKEKWAYDEKVDDLFRRGKFPDLKGVWGKMVIGGCWRGEYACACEALEALDLEEKCEGGA